jgi:hypothetical protein
MLKLLWFNALSLSVWPPARSGTGLWCITKVSIDVVSFPQGSYLA